jgi:hypothetical protein
MDCGVKCRGAIIQDDKQAACESRSGTVPRAGQELNAPGESC